MGFTLAGSREATAALVLSSSCALLCFWRCLLREKLEFDHFFIKFYNSISKSLPSFISFYKICPINTASLDGHLVVGIL